MADAKDNDNTNNAGSDDAEKKQQHIKDRLKEMGVASDSPRPQKSWLSKSISFIIIAVVAVLVAAYVYEYKNQSEVITDETITTQSVDQSAEQPYVATQDPVTSGTGNNQQPWQQQQWQKNQWLQQQQLQQEEMQKRREEAQLAQQQAYNQAKLQQQYWQQGYQYQPSPGYWPQNGAYYGYRQPVYGGNYPQQNTADNSINYNRQQPPACSTPLPYPGQPYYNGGYR